MLPIPFHSFHFLARFKPAASFSVIAFSTSLLLSACGGGGGSASNDHMASSSAAAQNGTINLALTDGPSDDFTHVWVTVKAISFHTDPDQTWTPADATWQTTTLPAPVTIDLAALNNGKLNNMFQGMSLPAGTYRQIRFFFASADDDLTTSAQSNTPALQWNDQVEYVDRKGQTQEAPLEIAYPTQGIQLNGTFKVDANSTLNLAVDVDLEESIVPFKHDGALAFTMKPTLRYFDLNLAGAIAGKIDPAQLCANTNPTTVSNANCAYNLVVKAELPGANRHVVARATTLRADGSFALFPLPTKDLDGNTLTYDVIIRGRNMETLLVKTVPVTLGSTADLTPTQLQSTPISLTVNNNEYTAQFDSALQPLTSGWALFQQTLSGDTKPYEIRWGNTDPFTGQLLTPIALARGPLHVATYNSGNTLSFVNQSPSETGSDGSYSVATNDNIYYTLSNNLVVQAPNVGNTLTFTPPVPTLDANVSAGTVSGNLAVVNNSRGYDHAQLVLVRFANIITTVDISSLLTNGGAFQLTQVPAGSAAHAVKGAYYYAYVRLWKAGSLLRPKLVPINGMIDLRTTNSVTGLNVTINN